LCNFVPLCGTGKLFGCRFGHFGCHLGHFGPPKCPQCAPNGEDSLNYWKDLRRTFKELSPFEAHWRHFGCPKCPKWHPKWPRWHPKCPQRHRIGSKRCPTREIVPLCTTWYHSVPLRATFYHSAPLVPLCITLFHFVYRFVSLCATWERLVRLCATLYHSIPLCTTFCNFVQPRTTALCTTRNHRSSQEPTGCHYAALQLLKRNSENLQGPTGNRGRGLAHDSGELPLYNQTARAQARTHAPHGTTRNDFPLGLTPPTSDIYIYIYIYIYTHSAR